MIMQLLLDSKNFLLIKKSEPYYFFFYKKKLSITDLGKDIRLHTDQLNKYVGITNITKTIKNGPFDRLKL